MDEESQEERPLSETELCVKYTGTANLRLLSRFDLSGVLLDERALDQMIWAGKGTELPWATWLDYAGSEEQALKVFEANKHEFELVGPGAENVLSSEYGEEEFSFEEKAN